MKGLVYLVLPHARRWWHAASYHLFSRFLINEWDIMDIYKIKSGGFIVWNQKVAISWKSKKK